MHIDQDIQGGKKKLGLGWPAAQVSESPGVTYYGTLFIFDFHVAKKNLNYNRIVQCSRFRANFSSFSVSFQFHSSRMNLNFTLNSEISQK